VRRFGAAACLVLAPAALAADQAAPQGIETGDLDRSAAPCADFDAFANGGWRAANPVPPSMVRWGRLLAAEEATKDRLNAILDELAASPKGSTGSVEQRLGDHYAACMDEARVESLGLDPVRPLLAEIDGLTDIAGVLRVVGRLHELAVPVPFGLAAAPDPRDPARVITHLYASGLGLPGRGYYLKAESPFPEMREKYRTHVAHFIELGGASRGASRVAADAVFSMERQLAAASLDDLARRAPKATDHPTTFVDLTNLAPNFDWPGYFAGAKLPRATINVREPEFLRALDRLFLDTPLSAWKAYLKWHLLRSASPFLSSAFVKEGFAFEGQVLGGVKEMEPRWKRCVESTDELLGEALARKYVEKQLPPAAKARAQEIIRDLLLAAGRDLDDVAPAARAKSSARVAAVVAKVAYPDTWKDAPGPSIGRETLWANVAAARRWRVAEDRSRIGKPVDRTRWQISALAARVSYDPLLGELIVPAGILQPPAFSMDAADAVNFGGLGALIGHEIVRGLVDRTDEATGHPSGLRVAHRAFLESRAGRPPAPVIDGFTPEQQFFLAWAQLRGEAVRPGAPSWVDEPCPVGRDRVVGPLSALPEFREAFSCPADAPVVPPPAKQCEAW